MTDKKVTENPLESLASSMAFAPHDFSAHHRLAWIYGIVFGWGELTPELAKQHGWTTPDVARLERLHARFKQLQAEGGPPDRVRHLKRGTTYDKLGAALVQADAPLHDGDAVVVYRGDKPALIGGVEYDLFVRPPLEFYDPGRFAPVEDEH